MNEQLQKWRKEAAIQTFVVHGLSGVGKTQIAVEYAWKHLGDYDAVLWVESAKKSGVGVSQAEVSLRPNPSSD